MGGLLLELPCIKEWAFSYTVCMYAGRSKRPIVCMQVDPKDLSAGLHHAEVIGVDSGNEWRGPLFRCGVLLSQI